MGRRLGPHLRRVDRVAVALDHAGMERVLDVGRRIGLTPETRCVALVLGEQQFRCAIAREPVLAQLGMRGLDDAGSHLAERRLGLVRIPRPGIAEPERRQDAQPGRFRPAVVHRDADEDILGTGLRVFHEHVEIAAVVEDAGVEQLVFELVPRSVPVRVDEVAIGKLALRVLVQILHVRVRGCAVDVEVVLLHVFAVVALVVREPEQALFQDRIPPVPQRHGEAEALLVVAQPPEPVLAPPVGARPRLIVGEVVPRVAVLAVVLANGAPLPLAEIRSPFLPGNTRLPCVVQPLLFAHVWFCAHWGLRGTQAWSRATIGPPRPHRRRSQNCYEQRASLRFVPLECGDRSVSHGRW